MRALRSDLLRGLVMGLYGSQSSRESVLPIMPSKRLACATSGLGKLFYVSGLLVPLAFKQRVLVAGSAVLLPAVTSRSWPACWPMQQSPCAGQHGTPGRKPNGLTDPDVPGAGTGVMRLVLRTPVGGGHPRCHAW